MPDQREVAGLTCGEVLARLSDFIDKSLPDSDKSRVEAHLRGCDWCERFGGEFAAVVAGLRTTLTTPPPLDDDVSQRLSARLASKSDPHSETKQG